DVAVEASRADQGGVEVLGPVSGPDDQDVGRREGRLGEAVAGRQPGVDGVDDLATEPDRPRRLFERLELDQQLVDDAGHALALGGARAPLAADGVELLDEADGTALAAGMAAQLLEVGADLPV